MDIQGDVVRFMRAAGQDNFYANWDTRMSDLYFKLVKEEYGELKHAYETGDYVEVADAIADLVWVTMGLASAMGMDFKDIWEEIKSSNMTKLNNMKFRKDGKIIKGKDFRPVNLPAVLPPTVDKDGVWFNVG